MIDNAAQYIAQAFKEYKYYNSHTLHMEELMCAVCRIELPSSINVMEDIPEDIHVTAYLTVNQVPIHEYPISTNFAIKDASRNSLSWDYVLSFPLKFRELARNAMLILTAWTPSGKPLGGTSISFFDELGCLRRGKQKLLFYMNRIGDAKIVNNSTPGEAYHNKKYDKLDYLFVSEKHLEAYKCNLQTVPIGQNNSSTVPYDNNIGKTEWLDKLTLVQLQNTMGIIQNSADIASEGNPKFASPFHYGGCDEEYELYTKCWIIIELPLFMYPVIHDEKPYSINHNNNSATSNFYSSNTSNTSAKSCILENERGYMEFSIVGKDFSPSILTFTKDWEMDEDNIFEEQYCNLERDMLRGVGDRQDAVKPNIKEKDLIDQILSASRNHLSPSQRDLIFRFRYFLTDNKKALTKYLLSVNWDSEPEVNEVPVLLNLWSTKAPIDISDALKLLGREKAFQRSVVREYAVAVMRKATDDDLRMFLSQLVQALRYDIGIAANGSSNEVNLQTNSISTSGNSSNVSPLANFLIDRACTSVSLSNYLFWYLTVETKDNDGMGPTYNAILGAFLWKLKGTPEGEIMTHRLDAADIYMNKIFECQREGRAVCYLFVFWLRIMYCLIL